VGGSVTVVVVVQYVSIRQHRRAEEEKQRKEVLEKRGEGVAWLQIEEMAQGREMITI
jgi:hypothetical protein